MGQGLDFVASRVSDFFFYHTGHVHKEKVIRRGRGICMTVGSTSRGQWSGGGKQQAPCFPREHLLLLHLDDS